jgi:hypothetical protein
MHDNASLTNDHSDSMQTATVAKQDAINSDTVHRRNDQLNLEDDSIQLDFNPLHPDPWYFTTNKKLRTKLTVYKGDMPDSTSLAGTSYLVYGKNTFKKSVYGKGKFWVLIADTIGPIASMEFYNL